MRQGKYRSSRREERSGSRREEGATTCKDEDEETGEEAAQQAVIYLAWYLKFLDPGGAGNTSHPRFFHPTCFCQDSILIPAKLQIGLDIFDNQRLHRVTPTH